MLLFLHGLLGEFEYFKMSEYGENNGMVHLHVFIKGIEPPKNAGAFQELHRAISDAWYEITGDSFEVRISKMKQHADRYFMKYILKNTQEEFTNSLILAWACGLRVWSCSRGFWDSYTTHTLDEFEAVDTTAGSNDDMTVNVIEWELLGVIEVQDDVMRENDTTIWVLRAESGVRNDHG
jgi:hypothetical protein